MAGENIGESFFVLLWLCFIRKLGIPWTGACYESSCMPLPTS